MSKPLKFIIAGLLLLSTALAYVLSRPQSQPTWDGTALLSKAEQALEGLPAKEAAEIRALLVSTGPSRYDDRASAWLKAAIKGNTNPVSDYAVASLRAMAQAGDTEAMWHLNFVLTQRIATADEGFTWLRRAAQLGHPRSLFDQTEFELRDRPAKLAAAMVKFSDRPDSAGLNALHWLAEAHEKGDRGLPKDAVKAADYRASAQALSDKLYPPRAGK
jgi:TPR repeat protein